jgi:hypothetical protein
MGSVIFEKIDSIKKTRRANDSNADILYNRDVDFGYTQEKIEIVFNGSPYIVNLLLKQDTVIFASADLNAYIGGADPGFESDRKIKIDTAGCKQYLKLHNDYYFDTKNIHDLAEEISSENAFGLYCGDGAPKSQEGKHIDTLVIKKDTAALSQYLKSINCEQQAYGLYGFAGLKKTGARISSIDKKLVRHITKRKSALVECTGCFVRVIQPKKK